MTASHLRLASTVAVLAALVTAVLLAGCESHDKSDSDDDAAETRPRRKRGRSTTHVSASAAVSTSVAPAMSAAPAETANERSNGPREVPRLAQLPPTDVAPTDLVMPPSVVITASGLATLVLAPGHGVARVGPNDQVRVHYSGWMLDGRLFDTSSKRGQPSQFGVHQVIAGWQEALQLMVEGERRRLWIPAALAYGDTPKRAGAPAGMLVFDVEIVEVIKAPSAPADLNAPPADAVKTKSGLMYRVLGRGHSSVHPLPSSKVEVHYSGWTTDGKLFDSSRTRNKSATFGVSSVIKGWTEVLLLMSPGDHFRVWIPASLAYGDKPRSNNPGGRLTFDIELIAIR